MTPEPTAINPNMSLVDVSHLMLDCGIGFLPVVDDGRLVGVITDRDLVIRGLAENRSAPDTPVHELMSVEIVCCFAEQNVEEAKALMLEHDLRRLPVIDAEHRLLGILSRPQLEMPCPPKREHVRVTFNKTKTDSYGRQHPVKVKTLYITTVRDEDAAVEAAVRHIEEEQSTKWQNVADKIDVQKIRSKD